MTDEDVILRCQEITNLGHVLGPYPSTSGTKPYWLWQVSTSSEAAALIMTLYPLLSHRRQERARDVLEVWRGRRVPGKAACGNMAGYGRHIKDVTPVCDPCAEASRFYHRERRARLRAAKEVA